MNSCTLKQLNKKAIGGRSTPEYYSLLFSTFFFLYCLNSIRFEEIKLFYFALPVTIMCGLLKYYNSMKLSKSLIYLVLMVFSAFISIGMTCIFFDDDSVTYVLGSSIELLIVTICCVLFYNIRGDKLFKYLFNYSLLFVIISLVQYSIYPSSRFMGFFSDPNYFCGVIILNHFFIIYYLLNYSLKSRFSLVCGSLSTLGCIFLIFSTGSRSGFLGFALYFIFVYFFISEKMLKGFFVLVLFIVGIIIMFCLNKNFQNQIYFLLNRFSGNDYRDVGAAMSRIYEMKYGLNYISHNASTILFGVGVGLTNNKFLFVPFGATGARIHNTFFAVFFEQGIVGFVLFLLILLHTYRKLRKIKNNRNSILVFGLFGSQILISLFVWSIYFLPFWLSITVVIKICRDKMQNKYNDELRNQRFIRRKIQ